MRCIDADALKDRFQNLAYDDWNQGTSTSWADAYLKCADIVDEQPTIEPERKKGKWEIYIISMLDGEGCKCSECGFEGVPYWDYCPNCGADMRGEKDESD